MLDPAGQPPPPRGGINGLQVDQLPSPAARFMGNPLISGKAAIN
ncbi:hypothetical protein [Arthrobacter sp. PAMC25284]|nr:hypothetical protein [Arthrobacter sp. PAMC25284]